VFQSVIKSIEDCGSRVPWYGIIPEAPWALETRSIRPLLSTEFFTCMYVTKDVCAPADGVVPWQATQLLSIIGFMFCMYLVVFEVIGIVKSSSEWLLQPKTKNKVLKIK